MGTNDNFGQAWDDGKKSALVAQLVNGKLSVKAACERHGLSPETIQEWVRVFRRTTLQALDDHLRQTFLIQGADAASLGTAEYTGTLADIPIADLIQTFHLGGKDGVISVTRDGQRSRIWCQRGEIVDAESGRLRGEAALFHILGFDRGQVFADFRSEPRERCIELPANVLLLEAARRKDERARLLEKLGDLGAVYRPGSAAPSAGATELERRLLERCDGQRSLGDVLGSHEGDELDALAALAALAERGELEQAADARPQPVAPAALVVSKGQPTEVVTFAPFAGTQHPAPAPARRPALGIAALGVALLLGGVIWGLWTAESRRASAPPAPPRGATAAATAPVQVRAPETYRVDSSAEPEHAELWLDGFKVGVGRLQRELPRDGRAHSLRIVAEGYAPTTLLFADAPPPLRIVLEKLDLEPASESAPALRATSEAPRAQFRPAPSGRPRRASSAAVPSAERAPGAERATPDAAPPAPSAPRVQIIETPTPVVRVID